MNEFIILTQEKERCVILNHHRIGLAYLFDKAYKEHRLTLDCGEKMITLGKYESKERCQDLMSDITQLYINTEGIRLYQMPTE